MPSKGTPARAIRLSDDVWQRTKQAAAVYGRTPTEVVRVALETWLEDPQIPLSWQIAAPYREDQPK